MIGRLACLLGLHRYLATHGRPRWDGAHRVIDGVERCQRRGCRAERFFERRWTPKERVTR